MDDIEIPSLKTDYHETDNTRQKEALLDVGGELSISIKGGMIKGTVKLDYLNREKKNRSEKSVSCILKITTKEQSFIPRKMLDNIHWEVLAETQATHVLTGKHFNAGYAVTHCFCYIFCKSNVLVSFFVSYITVTFMAFF